MKNIDKKAREFIEETGVNVAYMAFGFIHWKESDSSSYVFRAPVLLVPIQLEQASAVEPYFIKSAEDDIIVNPTFAYKMDAEHGVKLPEYYPLVQKLGGQVIRISPVSSDYINPLDINVNYSEEENPLTLKSDFILSMCELIVGGKDGLQPVEKTIIDRSVRKVYQDYLADPVPEKMPILEDLYNILRSQSEPEAQRIATALEIYVHGSLNVFNHRTNVDVNNRFVCYDIKQLGKQLKKLGMLIVQDQVWNRVTINRAQHKATRY